MHVSDTAAQASSQASRRTSIQAIDRAIALLDAIAEGGPNGLPLGMLAERTDLAPSTAGTILSSLLSHDLVTQRGGRNYFLGSRFFELNRQFVMGSDLASVAAPVLRSLWQRTRETAHLAVLQGTRRVDLAVLVSPQLLRVDPTSPGLADPSEVPLYTTAAGKVLFAGLSRRDRLAMLDAARWRQDDPPETDSLMAQMDEVVSAGFATNLEEEEVGVCGVAAPVHDQSDRTVAALCLGYPAVRHTTAHAAWLREEVMSAASTLSELLGTGMQREQT